jgi:hypothetical protein
MRKNYDMLPEDLAKIAILRGALDLAKIAILRGALDLASTELYGHVDCAHCDIGVEPDILIAVEKALHATTPDHIADAGKKVEQEKSAAPAQPIETGSTYRNIEAKRLRRLCALVGLSNAIPETDRELHDCMFSVLGMICRKVAEERPINDCGKD